MKTKIYLAILALVCLSGAARAQQGVYIGPNFVYSMTSLIDRERWGDVNYDYLYTSGYTAGMVGGFNVSQTFGVQTELNYVWTGMNTRQNVAGVEFEKRVNLQYIQLPVLFKYMAPTGPARFVLSGGPYVAFNTGAKLKATGGPPTTIVTPAEVDPNENPDKHHNGYPYGWDGYDSWNGYGDWDGGHHYGGKWPKNHDDEVIVPTMTQTIIPGPYEKKIKDQIHAVDVGMILNIGAEFTLSDKFNLGLMARGLYGFTNVNKTDQVFNEFGGDRERLGNASAGVNMNLQYFILRY